MNDIFYLSVSFNGNSQSFQVTRQKWGDSFRYAVMVEDIGVLFEPNDDRQFKAVILPGQFDRNKILSPGLLEAICKEFEKLAFKNG